MPSNLVVAGYRDGRREKGTTFDFVPTKDSFHLQNTEGEMKVVQISELKAVFFVKDLEGDWTYETINEFSQDKRPPGRKIRVVFEDDEELLGTTQGYDPTRKGFFVNPADQKANNQRVFVVANSVKEVALL